MSEFTLTPDKTLQGAARLMDWLGENAPTVQKIVRSFYGQGAWRSYMRDITGIDPNRFYATHDDECEAYLDALKSRYAEVLAKNISEPKRPPLTWADSKPFDPFKGFFKGSQMHVSTTCQPQQRGYVSPDLKPAGHQVNPGHGSALLVKG